MPFVNIASIYLWYDFEDGVSGYLRECFLSCYNVFRLRKISLHDVSRLW